MTASEASKAALAASSDVGSTTHEPDLRPMGESLGDGVYGMGPHGLCTFVNRGALRPLDGEPVVLDDEPLWRRDGTSLYAEYASHPMVVGNAVVGSAVRFEGLSRKRQARRRLAVQQQVGEILGGAAEVADAQKRVLAAIGSGFGWDDGSMWLADASRADGAGAGPVASWPRAGASEDASGDGEHGRTRVVQAIDLAGTSMADRHGEEAHRTFVASPIRLAPTGSAQWRPGAGALSTSTEGRRRPPPHGAGRWVRS